MTHIYADENYDRLLKILIVGETGVGKSALLTRFADDTFSHDFMTTIGVDFKFRNITLDNKKIRLQIWDTAGQERFRTITTCYYRGAQGVLLVFDVTQPETFQKIPEWMEEIRKHCKKDVKIILAANKVDLVKERVVDTHTIEEFASKHNLKFIETSAKDNINVEKVFKELASSILQLKGPQPNSSNIKIGQTVVITSPQEKKDEPCAC